MLFCLRDKFSLMFIIERSVLRCFVFSGDELMITELLFNGAFNDLTSPQACALLSCFVFQEGSNDVPKLTEALAGPLRLLQVNSSLYKLDC